MRILLSNDDGVHAPGLKALIHELSDMAEVLVVAPLEERSTTGHTLTLDHPLRVVEIDKDIFGCSGYPADCVVMGLMHLFKQRRPDLVITGINRGANLGQDTYYSGTVAAAREAAFHRVPAIAVSTVMDFINLDPKAQHYDTAAKYVRQLVLQNIHNDIKEKTLLNINVPNLPDSKVKGSKVTRLGFRKYSEDVDERQDSRKRPYYWIGGIYSGFEPIEGSDCQAIDQGMISITPINLLAHGDDEALLGKWKRIIG